MLDIRPSCECCDVDLPPDFVTSPDGELFPTVYYFKQLDA